MNLRPMTMDDADFMLTLKNYPETREFALVSKEEILICNHINYLKGNMQYFQVIEEGDDIYSKERIGVVRVQDNEISIWVVRSMWGCGIARRIIALVATKDSWAKIACGNISSLRAFIWAGFKPISFHDTYYIFKK